MHESWGSINVFLSWESFPLRTKPISCIIEIDLAWPTAKNTDTEGTCRPDSCKLMPLISIYPLSNVAKSKKGWRLIYRGLRYPSSSKTPFLDSEKMMEYLISGSMQNKKQTHTVMKLDTVPYLGSTVEGRLGERAKDGDKGWRDREREGRGGERRHWFQDD